MVGGRSTSAGIVFYDTEKHEVTGYTQSQYAPFIDEDGDIIIPE